MPTERADHHDRSADGRRSSIGVNPVVADPCDRPQKRCNLNFNLRCSMGTQPVVADLRDRPQKICNKYFRYNKDVLTDLNDRTSYSVLACVATDESVLPSEEREAEDPKEPKDQHPQPFPGSSGLAREFAEEGKLGFGFTPSDELESVDIGPGDRPRPTWISKRLDPEFKAKLVKLLREFPDCFAWEYHEMPGLDRSIIEHRLPIKPGYRPFAQHPRKVDVKILDTVKAEIERIIEAGFIRPCRYATWISSIVPVWKKSGKLRICIDFRDLNRATPKDEYPMPVAEMLIDAAAGHKMMSFLDGNAGYNQIFMAEEDVYKTAFRCPQGLFEFVVMTFGLRNAGATYQRAMNYIFHDLIGRIVEIYIDDVLVKSALQENHLADLR
jgi:hypothetical protein